MSMIEKRTSVIPGFGLGHFYAGAKGQVVAPLNAGFGMAVSAKSQHKKIAMKYLSFMARPDVTLKYNTVIGGIDPAALRFTLHPSVHPWRQVQDFVHRADAAGQRVQQNRARQGKVII